MRKTAYLLSALLLTLCACTGGGGWINAYNECQTDKGGYVGRTTVELDVRKVQVRTGEVPVGDLVVDAIFEAAAKGCVQDSTDKPCPIAAVENAGGIRSSTSCGDRTSIPIGALNEQDIKDLLPFNTNQIVVVEVTGEELVLMLERSVTLLGQVGEAGAAGFFLHVHNIALEIDCAKPAQTLSLAKDKIATRGARIDATKVTVAGQPLVLTDKYNIAMNSFVGSAGDGFLALAERNPDDSVVLDAAGKMKTKPKKFVTLQGNKISESDVVMSYIKDKPKQTVAPIIEGRIRVLPTCTPSE